MINTNNNEWYLNVVKKFETIEETLGIFLDSISNKGVEIHLIQKDAVFKQISMLANTTARGEYIHILYHQTKALAEAGDPHIKDKLEEMFPMARLLPLPTPKRIVVYDILDRITSQPQMI